MQLNFAGLLLLGVGVLLLGLGISGNYGSFGKSLRAGLTGGKGSEATTTPREPSGGTSEPYRGTAGG